MTTRAGRSAVVGFQTGDEFATSVGRPARGAAAAAATTDDSLDETRKHKLARQVEDYGRILDTTDVVPNYSAIKSLFEGNEGCASSDTVPNIQVSFELFETVQTRFANTKQVLERTKEELVLRNQQYTLLQVEQQKLQADFAVVKNRATETEERNTALHQQIAKLEVMIEQLQKEAGQIRTEMAVVQEKLVFREEELQASQNRVAEGLVTISQKEAAIATLRRELAKYGRFQRRGGAGNRDDRKEGEDGDGEYTQEALENIAADVEGRSKEARMKLNLADLEAKARRTELEKQLVLRQHDQYRRHVEQVVSSLEAQTMEMHDAIASHGCTTTPFFLSSTYYEAMLHPERYAAELAMENAQRQVRAPPGETATPDKPVQSFYALTYESRRALDRLKKINIDSDSMLRDGLCESIAANQQCVEASAELIGFLSTLEKEITTEKLSLPEVKEEWRKAQVPFFASRVAKELADGVAAFSRSLVRLLQQENEVLASASRTGAAAWSSTGSAPDARLGTPAPATSTGAASSSATAPSANTGGGAPITRRVPTKVASTMTEVLLRHHAAAQTEAVLNDDPAHARTDGGEDASLAASESQGHSAQISELNTDHINRPAQSPEVPALSTSVSPSRVRTFTKAVQVGVPTVDRPSSALPFTALGTSSGADAATLPVGRFAEAKTQTSTCVSRNESPATPDNERSVPSTSPTVPSASPSSPLAPPPVPPRANSFTCPHCHAHISGSGAATSADHAPPGHTSTAVHQTKPPLSPLKPMPASPTLTSGVATTTSQPPASLTPSAAAKDTPPPVDPVNPREAQKELGTATTPTSSPSRQDARSKSGAPASGTKKVTASSSPSSPRRRPPSNADIPSEQANVIPVLPASDAHTSEAALQSHTSVEAGSGAGAAVDANAVSVHEGLASRPASETPSSSSGPHVASAEEMAAVRAAVAAATAQLQAALGPRDPTQEAALASLQAQLQMYESATVTDLHAEISECRHQLAEKDTEISRLRALLAAARPPTTDSASSRPLSGSLPRHRTPGDGDGNAPLPPLRTPLQSKGSASSHRGLGGGEVGAGSPWSPSTMGSSVLKNPFESTRPLPASGSGTTPKAKVPTPTSTPMHGADGQGQSQSVRPPRTPTPPPRPSAATPASHPPSRSATPILPSLSGTNAVPAAGSVMSSRGGSPSKAGSPLLAPSSVVSAKPHTPSPSRVSALAGDAETKDEGGATSSGTKAKQKGTKGEVGANAGKRAAGTRVKGHLAVKPRNVSTKVSNKNGPNRVGPKTGGGGGGAHAVTGSHVVPRPADHTAGGKQPPVDNKERRGEEEDDDEMHDALDARRLTPPRVALPINVPSHVVHGVPLTTQEQRAYTQFVLSQYRRMEYERRFTPSSYASGSAAFPYGAGIGVVGVGVVGVGVGGGRGYRAPPTTFLFNNVHYDLTPYDEYQMRHGVTHQAGTHRVDITSALPSQTVPTARPVALAGSAPHHSPAAPNGFSSAIARPHLIRAGAQQYRPWASASSRMRDRRPRSADEADGRSRLYRGWALGREQPTHNYNGRAEADGVGGMYVLGLQPTATRRARTQPVRRRRLSGAPLLSRGWWISRRDPFTTRNKIIVQRARQYPTASLAYSGVLGYHLR